MVTIRHIEREHESNPEPQDPGEEAATLYRIELDECRQRLDLIRSRPGLEASAARERVDHARGNGPAPTATIARIAALDPEVAVQDQAINDLWALRREAIAAIGRQEARPLREQAEQQRAEADEREVKTKALLDELREWEGCEYVPARPRPAAARLVAAVGGSQPLERVTIIIPWTQWLRQEADRLEGEAVAAEQRQPIDYGSIDAGSLDELVAAIESYDPLCRGPRLDLAVLWAEPRLRAVQAKIDAILPHHDAYGSTPKLRLHWKGGQIDEVHSECWAERPPAPKEWARSESWPGR